MPERKLPLNGEQWKDFRGEVGTVTVYGPKVTWTPNNEEAYDGAHPREYWIQDFLNRNFRFVEPSEQDGS